MIYVVRRFSTDDSNKVILPGNTRPCDPLPTRFIDPPEFRGLKRFIQIESTKRYDDELKTHQNITRKRIKNLRKSLKEGHLYDNGNFQSEETHYAGKFSKPGKYHRFTKDIDSHNRLDYLVYPSELFEDPETGEQYILIRVVLQRCIGHYDWIEKRYYSDTSN